MATRIFLRDDDVGALTPAFLGFFRLFSDRGIPVSYQIIPERFTADCAEFLRAERTRTPDLVDLGQHGLRHQMEVGAKVVFHEFGPERSYAEQLGDIQEGRAILYERLGEAIPLKVFTPPRHRYDLNTLKAIKASGFEVLSASSYTSARHRLAYAVGRALGLSNLGRPGVPWHGRVRPDSGLFELSVAVGADDGGAITGSVDAVVAAIEAARQHTDEVGLMFHHQAYEGPEGQAYLAALADRLKALEDVTFHTIADLYAWAQARPK
jgi:uncharacterized protein DUF2334